MTRGRKPRPTHLKLVEGNPGKRPLNKKEAKPVVPLTMPDPPEFLNEEGKREWFRRGPDLLRLGILTEADVAPFAAYCQAYGRWHAAELTLIEMGRSDLLTGAMLINTKGGNTIQNPMLGVANRAQEQMTRLAAEFGMTPSARSRINVDELANDPLALLLGMPDRRA